MSGMLEVTGVKVINNIILDTLELTATNNNTIKVQTQDFQNNNVDLYEVGVETSNVYNPEVSGDGPLVDTNGSNSDVDVTTQYDYDVTNFSTDFNVVYNASFYVVANSTVTFVVEMTVDIIGSPLQMVLPLPYTAKRTSVGQIVIKDPADNNFVTDLGSVYIDKNDKSNLIIKSNLLNDRFKSQIFVHSKIIYSKF